MNEQIVIENFIYDKKYYTLTHPIVLERKTEGDVTYYYEPNLDLPIDQTEEAAVKDRFYEEFSIRYQFYRKQKDKNLPVAAQELKKRLLDCVQEVKRV